MRRSPSIAHFRAPRTCSGKLLPLALLALLLLGGGVAAALYAVAHVGMAPRQVGPYLAQRSAGHNGMIEGAGRKLATTLAALDGGAAAAPTLPAWNVGAQDSARPMVAGHPVSVASAGGLMQALAGARPGDVITLQPGNYRFSGLPFIAASAAGSKERPITVRAERPGTATIEFNLSEGFLVTGPYWTFENLAIRGACAEQAACEHAFHVAGRASGFVARNNTITDFNAHFKINAQAGSAPDDGLIEGNTLSNGAVRQTSQPVTPIDLVAGSRWTIRGNLISDFIKAGGDGVSYGAYAKGAGSANLFERNVVLCEHKLRGHAGQRVGLSLGGGGTGVAYCRDQRCITEQDGGTIQSNLIASCSDEGIYLNRAATSKVLHNTLIDTAGIMVRYPESGALVDGNIVDGRLRAEHGATVQAGDNLDTSLGRLFMGSHPQRALFRDALGLDLAWAGAVARRSGSSSAAAPGTDLCGASRPAQPAYGAVEDFAACLRR
ncbi:right-handed parallel beta-helix repeat-containing protein [Massilia sp. Root418]|uniref:right-handed parallel beta-helix repeat-containing protein n=1 Tax=Massilia sp. Root418 TaxID=1736532 RepID=UPI0009E94F54|nr:right-handed parallel beta-helix repeat-containing protein [Massilia sp. Root418]